MNQLLKWLADGDLRTDGSGTEVADLVLQNPQLLKDLLDGLKEPNEVVRGHTAHALERVSRSQPDLLLAHLPQLIRSAKHDKVAMVRWHLAMLLGNVAAFEEYVQVIISTLLDLLQDDSAFVRSWAIASLCIVGRQYPRKSGYILKRIAPLQQDDSIAIRNRARRAVDLLMHDRLPLPVSWVKSERFKQLTDVDRASRSN